MFSLPLPYNFSMGYASSNQTFRQYFRCYPVAMLPGKEREGLNYIGKVVLPPSALNRLTMLNISYPMTFKLTNKEAGKVTHTGVLEFIAEEGRVYLPQWTMETLEVQPGDLIQVASLTLPLGTFVKIEPQTTDFLNISNPKAVLESSLRSFSALSVDDIFKIQYNDKVLPIKVLEVKPDTKDKSICVVETDLEVDFAPPKGYVEPVRTTQPVKEEASRSLGAGAMSKLIDYEGRIVTAEKNKEAKTPFGSLGQQLSDRKKKPETDIKNEKPQTFAELRQVCDTVNQIPDTPLNLPFGQIFFGYPYTPMQSPDDKDETNSKTTSFQGEGQSLRASKKRKDIPLKNESTPKRQLSPDVIEID